MPKSKQDGWPASGFGERLRVLRESRGWSQARLAEEAGCNVFTVSKTERGRQEPAWPLVLALADALGVEVGAFVARGNGAAAEPAPRGRPRKTVPEQAGSEQPKRPRGRPRKAPATAQDEASASKATSAPSGQKKPAREQGRKRKGKGE